MQENQNIEYKSSWRDEYLKWVCGFANAQGGTLFIGKDDDGNIVGLKNAKRLMEELPNKITTIMGIIAAVNLHETKQGDFIEIIVEPQPHPVNYIGFFQTESDILYQDDIHGNLFEQIEKTMELMLTKYIKAIINYKGLSRIETHEYPKEALREALLNAVAHKDYSGGAPIQIRVYNDKIMIWNQGQLPENWTIEKLLQKHPSRPYNPDIANAFFRSGYIESWGRGIEKMTEQCKKAGLPVPIITNEGSDFWIAFKRDIFNQDDLVRLGLNERQIKAVLYAKEKGKITNKEYQEINGCSRNTASSDFADLVNKAILHGSDAKGAGAYYQLN